MASVWFSPWLVDHCWAAASHWSSAGGSHREAQSKGSPVDDKNKLNLH